MTHLLITSSLAVMQVAHDTIHDERQTLKTRRLALLLFEAMDYALARYGNDFDPVRAENELCEYIESVPELPTLRHVDAPEAA